MNISYDEKSAKELLALLGIERNVDELLLDLAKMEIGQGVKSISNIVGTLLYLLDMGANVNALNIWHDTLLHNASETGNTVIIEVLLQRGADADIRNLNGDTALHHAAIGGYTPVIETLLRSESNKTQRSRYNALVLATSNDRTSTVKCLIKAGALTDIRNLGDDIPLYYAMFKDYVEVVEALLEAGASVDIIDQSGVTPLVRATIYGHVEVVERLLKAKAALNPEAGIHLSALIISVRQGLKQITELLLAAGADIRARRDYGETVLHAALRKHYWECPGVGACGFCTGSETRQNMLKLLCEKGADPSAKDVRGDSPLSLVYSQGYSESEQRALAKVLKEYGARS